MATNPNGGSTASLGERVRNILLTPKTEWPRIDAEPSTIGGIYRSYVVILAAIGPIAGLIGMLVFGYSVLGFSYRPSVGFALATALVQYVLSLVGVYVLALIIEALAPTFGGTKDRVKAFKVAAYASTAGWVAGILLLLPNLALIAALLGLYNLYLLYTGLPVLMKSPPDRSVGYIVAVIVAGIVLYLVIGMLVGAITAALVPMPGPATPYALPG